jgi:hypothetical protein
VLLDAVEALDAVDALDAADWARKHLVAAIVNPAIRYTVWRYSTEALAPSPNLCVDCEDRAGDTFELEDPDDLLDMFEYGEWLDDDTFSPNIHPNCRCLVVRQEDVYW